MRVESDISGYAVVSDGGEVLARFGTHAEAWRYVDRREGEPTSPAEKRSAYWWKMQLDE